MRDEVDVAEDRVVEVADLLRRVEDAPQQRAARADMPCPGIHQASEDHVDEALEAVQPALLHQVEAELAEAITPPCSRRSTAPAQCRARRRRSTTVAVAMLQAEIRHAADDETRRFTSRDNDRRQQRGKYVHRPTRDRIVHSGQVEQRLNRAFPYLPPQSARIPAGPPRASDAPTKRCRRGAGTRVRPRRRGRADPRS